MAITIKRILLCSCALLLIVAVMLVSSLIMVYKSAMVIDDAQQARYISFLLADELKESSRNLTAAIRKYAVTGDEIYADEYFDIIKIRAGEKARSDNRKIAPGQSISLNELMKQTNFTKEELTLLEQSNYLSDMLTELEIEAMNAVRGLFQDSSGEYSIIGQPDMDLATSLIFSAEYDEAVSMIMEPFDVFSDLINVRLDLDISTAQSNFNNSMRTLWIMLGVLVALAFSFILMVGLVIVRPILMCNKFANMIANGNLDAALNYTSGNEIGSLSSSLRSMVKSLLERIQLEEHARYFSAIIATADAGVAILDKDGIITDWNVGAEKILGYKSDEIIGHTRHLYTPESNLVGIDDIEERLHNCEHIAHVEVVRKHKNGNLIICSASYTPILDSSGIYNGSLAIFHDVTESKLAEQKARNLAAIVTVADAGIIVKDKDGAVLEWNIGAENIFGYRQEEAVGFTMHRYAPEEYHAGIDDVESRLQSGEHIAHLEVIRTHKDGRLIYCAASFTPIYDSSGNFDGSVAIFHDITDKKLIEAALTEAVNETEKHTQTIISSINYASRIQQNLLPRDNTLKEIFSDYSVIWEPRDIVGGDIYWVRQFDEGSLLCVCDCTGHGIPGALLTMLVASTFNSMVNDKNYTDTSQIMWLLDQRLAEVLNANKGAGEYGKSRPLDLNDGCDLAVLFIAKNGTVTISSCNTNVFVCDGTDVNRIKGQQLFIGEGQLNSSEDVKSVTVPANSSNKFYIASDGLFDQIGGESEPPLPFGYRTFKQIILNNHNESQAVISDIIWAEFESYRGSRARRDDVSLISFKA